MGVGGRGTVRLELIAMLPPEAGGLPENGTNTENKTESRTERVWNNVSLDFSVTFIAKFCSLLTQLFQLGFLFLATRRHPD